MSKKTSKIELRVSPELKERLRTYCDQNGETISDAIRIAVERMLASAAIRQPHTTRQIMSIRKTGIAGASLVSLGALFTAVLQAPATAQSAARATFAELDLDSDGVVTREEFNQVYGLARVDPIARVGDLPSAQSVTKLPEVLTEPSKLLGEPAVDPRVPDGAAFARSFEDIDTNFDDRLEYEELKEVIRSSALENFRGMDANNDGYLSRSEYAMRAIVVAELGHQRSSEFVRVRPTSAHGLALACPDGCVSGVVTRQETRIAFAVLDEDRDGRLSEREFANH